MARNNLQCVHNMCTCIILESCIELSDTAYMAKQLTDHDILLGYASNWPFNVYFLTPPTHKLSTPPTFTTITFFRNNLFSTVTIRCICMKRRVETRQKTVIQGQKLLKKEVMYTKGDMH